jgi:anthranilate synthase
MSVVEFVTTGGLAARRALSTETRADAGRLDLETIIDALDEQRGAVFASSCDVPGRYALWDRAFVAPPIAIECRDRRIEIQALNDRGQILLPALAAAAVTAPGSQIRKRSRATVEFEVSISEAPIAEEERTRQPSVFGLLRNLVRLFQSPDPHLGLYGVFGYDLAFQFDAIESRHPRADDQRDLVLYLPDEILVLDPRRERVHRVRYDFTVDGKSTDRLPREGDGQAYRPAHLSRGCDHEPGEYAQVVRRARAAFSSGDLFEVVPSQVFSQGCPDPPSAVFRRLREGNPAPYGFLVNLGRREYLVGASPEMYVRVGDPDLHPRAEHARRIETCPIAGTIARGATPLEDSAQITALLVSEKDASELTMCTDVDRNDKSRICEPASVRVTGHRQIELYSKLIHTVDHVEGKLREGFDALDAFLSHVWAVTVTGAPKRAAMRFIEAHELSPRRWYGGAVGRIGFDGRLDTGLALRTIRIADGVAEIRVGATLLYDSQPDLEEAETRLKAAAMLDAIRQPEPAHASCRVKEPVGTGRQVLLVDAQDSFVHSLGDYFRQTGAQVRTLRAGFPIEALDRFRPDLVVLSPGPGAPADFALDDILQAALARSLPVFGVCLGLQAIAEFFGGELGRLPEPVHGKASPIHVLGGKIFQGIPAKFRAGRYHSLHARRDSLPPELRVTAEDDAGLVMGLEHAELPVAGVQFHPESILTFEERVGIRLIENVVRELPARPCCRLSKNTRGG